MIYLDGTPAYVSFDRGNLWAMVRATDEATFDAQAKAVGLLVPKDPGAPAVIDQETGEVIREAIPPSEEHVPAPGVTIARLGPHVLVPGTYDADGNEVTPPEFDTRFHANFWLTAQAVALNNWQSWAKAWTLQGTEATANKSEQAVGYGGVELIDPDSVATPGNILARE